MSSESRDDYQELTDMLDFVHNGWLSSDYFDGPTFLWVPFLAEASTDDDSHRKDMPVAERADAEQVIGLPMEWYFRGIGSVTPSATYHGPELEIPRADMPTFRLDSQALAGVDSVCANALASTRWADSANNLALCLKECANFVSNSADRDNEGFDFLKDLIQKTRVYMESVARNATTEQSQQALAAITEVACSDDFCMNPMQMVELLSCALSFAQYDDTRMFAYDALNRATETMDRFQTNMPSISDDNQKFKDIVGDLFSDEDYKFPPIDNPYEDVASALFNEYSRENIMKKTKEQFEEVILYLRHDLFRISGDADDADGVLFAHADRPAFADAYAARLIAAGWWDEVIEFVDIMENDHPNQAMLMFPEELVPYEWESLREIALQALNNTQELMKIYRERIVEAFDPNDEEALKHLHHISGDQWPKQVELIEKEYDNGRGRYARNMIYEKLMRMQGLQAAAVKYVANFPEARPDLATLLH